MCLGLLGAAFGGDAAETLTVATYNVENYTEADRMTADGFRRDYPKPETEKTALRSVIRALGADVLALQEMGSAQYLAELQRDLKADGLDYPYTALLEADDADRHVALLSRRPFVAVVKHTDLEFPYFGAVQKVKRGLLEVRLTTAAGELTIFAVHLKSRYTDRPDDPRSTERRLDEAVAIRDAVLARFPDPAAARFLIVGDFNDDKSSKTVQRMLARGKTIVARLLPAVDSRGEMWTHDYHKQDDYTRVDHILVSHALIPAVQDGKAHIYDGPGVLEASDHRPVAVMLHF